MPRAQSWPWSGICVPWCYKDDPFGVLKSVFPTHLFFTQDHLYLEIQKAKVKNISFPYRVWWQFLGIMSLLYIVLPKIWTPLDLGKKVVFLLFFFSFLCLFGSVSCRDVTWWDHLWSFSWGGVGRDHGSHLFMLENWPCLPMPCCVFCPIGSSVQHLFHHRSRRLWPSLALPRGGRSDVHPGICWVHWSSARKHFPSQVCKYRTPLTHQEPDPHLTSGGHPVDARVSCSQRHWQDRGLGNAFLLGEHFRYPPPSSSTQVPAC